MENRKKYNKSGQVSFEYMVIIGFVTLSITIILGIAMVYSGSVRDQTRVTQMQNCINKIISTSESVFYAGEPSLATITCYLPENIKDITVHEGNPDGILVQLGTSNGVITRLFSSNVPMNGTLSSNPGVRRIKIEAKDGKAQISPA